MLSFLAAFRFDDHPDPELAAGLAGPCLRTACPAVRINSSRRFGPGPQDAATVGRGARGHPRDAWHRDETGKPRRRYAWRCAKEKHTARARLVNQYSSEQDNA